MRRRVEAAARAERRERLQAILAALLQAGGRVSESPGAGRAGFALEGGRVRVVSAARHIAVHFPQAELLRGIRAHHPELACGVRCVRIRDTQYVPIYELREAFARVLGTERSAPRHLRSPARAGK